MALLKNVRGWLFRQSDEMHSALAVGATACLVPALSHASPELLAAANLTSMATQFGSQVYVAFVGGPTMFVNMKKKEFGDIQARLFPKFGMVGLSTGILTLASYNLAHKGSFDTCTYLLVGSLSVHIINSFFIFPFVTKLMLKLREAKEDEVPAAKRNFGITHGVSNLINFVGMGANLAYLYILASRVAGVW